MNNVFEIAPMWGKMMRIEADNGWCNLSLVTSIANIMGPGGIDRLRGLFGNEVTNQLVNDERFKAIEYEYEARAETRDGF